MGHIVQLSTHDPCEFDGRNMFGRVMCHVQPVQNLTLWHPGERALPWCAGEMLDGHHQSVDVAAHAGPAHNA